MMVWGLDILCWALAASPGAQAGSEPWEPLLPPPNPTFPVFALTNKVKYIQMP